MKLKSKSLISIILAIMMVVSMVMFAVPANAATTDSDSVGADSYTLFYGNVNNPNDSSWKEVTMTQSGSSFTATVESGSQWSWTYFYIKDSSGTHCWPGSNSEIDATALNSKQVQSAQTNYGNINMKQIQVNTANITYLFSYNGSNTVTVSEAGSTDEPTTTQPTTTPSTDTTYYLTGRFGVKDDNGTMKYLSDSLNGWENGNKSSITFTKESDTLYSLDTNQTIKELSANTGNNTWFFQISDGTNKYRPNNRGSNLSLTATDADTRCSTGGSAGSFYFNDTDTSGNVILYFDSSSKEFYFKIEGSEDPDEPATKLSYIKGSNALWIDAKPTTGDDTQISTLIKWDNYTGSSHGTTTDYRFYVPKNVTLTEATIYNGFSSEVTLNNVKISANSSAVVNLPVGEYTPSGATTKTIKVMQGSTDAMFIEQEKGYLPTKINTAVQTDEQAAKYKEEVKIKGGTIITMLNDEDTPVFSDALAVDNIKGRGNSSWKASAQIFGKYAFNMKLEDATNLFGMDSAESTKGSKSWCLLANNADESMLRNALTYQLAAEIGLPYAPEFRFVDIYDNGIYMGSYLVTEKVDVGSKNLIKGESFDDINEDLLKDYNKTNSTAYEINEKAQKPEGSVNSPNSYKYNDIYMDIPDIGEPDYNSTGTYLLEFEIKDRCDNEASWFVSSQGQNVVVKSPEFATKNQVLFVQEKFNEMETAIFNNADVDELSKYMDVESFAKMYLIQELSANLDSAATSYYIMLDCSKGEENARFVASPVWDYDWAYGQYSKTNFKYDVYGESLSFDDPSAWVSKIKSKDNSEDKNTAKDNYSIQSKLADQNESFKSVIRYVWDNTFCSKIKNYYGDNSQLDRWKTQISASVAMNEKRWGFISPSNSYGTISDWGSKDTGTSFDMDAEGGTVYYLETKWLQKRVEDFLKIEFAEYPNDYTPEETPTLESVALTAFKTTVDVNENFTLTASITPDTVTDVTYTFYENDSEIESSSSNTVTINKGTAGTYTYKVTATANGKTLNSDTITVTVKAVESNPVLKRVILKSDKYSVNPGDTFTLTATHTDSEVACTYTFYQASGTTANPETDTVLAKDSASNKHTITVDDTFVVSYYYVVAKDANGGTVTSNVVTVSKGGVKNIRIYFKSASASVYVPSLSVDGATAVVMDRDKMTSDSYGTYFGTTYSGSLKFYWFYKDIEIDTSKTHTLTFSTKENRVYATSEASNFNTSNEYYFAVDNLMGDTELVDLTNEPEYIRNYHITATHMVRSVNEANNVGFTWIEGKEYAMGTYLADNDLLPTSTVSLINVGNTMLSFNSLKSSSYAPFSIKSATLAQKITADLTDVSDLQYQLLDVNLDGVVDVKDATMMQKALING